MATAIAIRWTRRSGTNPKRRARSRLQREPPYLAGLNPEQREAVMAVDGPVLVLAGAGTGKTRVLTTRLAHILATRRAWPGQILAVTFTNKAAREMKERIGALIGGVVEGMQWLGTFHSIGARMLRRHAELAGLKSNFTILDADDQLRLMKQMMRSRGHRREALAGAHAGRDDRRLEEPRPAPGRRAGWRRRMASRSARAASSIAQYQERLKSLNAADFGDLLLDSAHHPAHARRTSSPNIATASNTCWWTSIRTPTSCNICG